MSFFDAIIGIYKICEPWKYLEKKMQIKSKKIHLSPKNGFKKIYIYYTSIYFGLKIHFDERVSILLIYIFQPNTHITLNFYCQNDENVVLFLQNSCPVR